MTIDRRTMLTLAFAGCAGVLATRRANAAGQSTPVGGAMSKRTAHGFTFDALAGPSLQLADYAGHPILVVNTASLCGFTPQYAGLQQLWSKFRERGLMIIGVPSNDFGGQEPGGVKDIEETAQHQYGVTFPITVKTVVRGPDAHPFYKWAATERPADVPRWNFHKYLIGGDGLIADVFASEVEPTDPSVIAAITRENGGAARPTN
jgi:glutathione peroxidase